MPFALELGPILIDRPSVGRHVIVQKLNVARFENQIVAEFFGNLVQHIEGLDLALRKTRQFVKSLRRFDVIIVTIGGKYPSAKQNPGISSHGFYRAGSLPANRYTRASLAPPPDRACGAG